MLNKGVTKTVGQVVQTQFVDDATSPSSGATFIYGIARKPDGTLYICNLPTTQLTYQRGKFLVRADGVLIVSSSNPAIAGYDGPFALSSAGEMLVSTGSVVTSRDAFGFDSSGNLVVSAVS